MQQDVPARWMRRTLDVGPGLAAMILVGPVLTGLVFVILPSFGFLPALGGSAFSLEPWRQLFAQSGLWRSVVISVSSGLVTAAVSLTIAGLCLAGLGGSRIFAVMRHLVSPLLAVPHAAAALGLSLLIAPSGLVFRALAAVGLGSDRPPDLLIIHDPWGLAMMAGLILKEVPFLMLMALAALPQVDAGASLTTARMLGYGPVTAWLKTIAPQLYPLIRLPVLAVVAYAASAVDMAIILGPTNPPPLSAAVLRWQSDPELAARFMAAAGALLQLGATALALALWLAAEAGIASLAQPWLVAGSRRTCDRLLALCGGLAMAAVAAAALLGLALLALWSVAVSWRFPALWPQSFTWANWTTVLPATFSPLLATLEIGAASAAISFAVVLALLEREAQTGRLQGHKALWLMYAPLFVPPVAFLFGLTVAQSAAGVPLGLAPVILAHTVFVLPYVYLSLSEPYRRLDPRWSQLAATLGHDPWRSFWCVRLPLMLSPCLTALAVGFAVSAGQYLATQLIGAGRVVTLTTEAVALASGGDRRVIGVWALVQMLLPAMGFALAAGIPRLLWRHRRAMLIAK